MRAVWTLTAVMVAAPALAGSAWTVREGSGAVSVGFTHEAFERFYKGEEETDGPGETGIEQRSATLSATYGILPSLALDLDLAYTRVSFAEEDDVGGLADTRIGLSYALLDEFAEAPLSLAVRVGGIVAGTYDVKRATPNSPGEGAHGIVAAIGFGRSWGATGAWSFGDVGARYRADGVPADAFGSLGSGYSLQGAYVTAAVVHSRALSGSDIGDEGFEFTELKEVWTNVEAGVGYEHGASGLSVGLTYAQTVAGRNTGQKQIVSAGLGWAY